MPSALKFLTLVLILFTAVSCVLEVPPPPPAEDVIGDHMVAEATLTAHFIAAAVKAGMTTAEINAVLDDVASNTVITEFWITDQDGRTVFSNVSDLEFNFPTDPEAGTQAAPFANLLLGIDTLVVQEAKPRESDGAVFKYVGVVGVDQKRIVQVGLAEAE